jgi:transaldolase
MTTSLHRLRQAGQSPWIDFITRDFVRGGELAELMGQGIVGLTSNPTIFEQAIAEGNAYDDQLRAVLVEDQDPAEAFLALASQDVRGACDLLLGVFNRNDATRDGWASLEVDPDLAHDATRTAKAARRIHALVDRPNLFVKIPGTEEGLKAIEETIAAGIPVNVTLLFSLERHRQAAKAYIRGLMRLRHNGGDVRSVASVASFFVSRVDSEADRRLDEIGGHDHLKGTLAIANAKLAYQNYLELFSGPEWDELAAAGASPQRCLWASTSTKDPAYRDVMYVEQLIGPDTINTMPPKTVEAFLDHGRVERTVDQDVAGAHRTFEAFAELGIEYQEVVDKLEREGVEKFAASFRELIDQVDLKRDQLVTF